MHVPVPTRHTVGTIVFATLGFFGPLWVMAYYGTPLPPNVLDFVATWYTVAAVTLLIALIGPAHPSKD